MAQQRHIQTNFTAGELSPRLRGRVDLDRYANGAAVMENFLVTPHGGATRRPGTAYVGAVKDQTKRVRLVRFEVSTIATYVIEFGEGYARFYRNRALVRDGSSVPVEVVTPYTTAQLRELRFTQSADTLFICHPEHAPRKLVRTSATSFAISTVSFLNGPWIEQNANTALTLTPSATAGTISVVASASVFAATDVGRLLGLRTEAAARPAATLVNPGIVFYADDRGVVRLYEVVRAGTTAAASMAGTTPDYDLNMPKEEHDEVTDGTAVLKYLGRGKAGWGWGTITGYTSGTTVAVSVTQPLANVAATAAWKIGAWGTSNGWPRACTFYSGRFVLASTTAQPQTLWLSESGDFTSMVPHELDGVVLDTNAITVTIDDDQVNTVRWLIASPRGLIAGAPSGEFAIGPANPQQAFGPTNVEAKRLGDRGSSTEIAGLRVGGAILFVQRGRRKVRELQYDFGTDAYQTGDITILSEHVTGTGVVEAAYQEEPDGLLWLVREDGALCTLTYDREQQVRGWSRHVLGGEDAAVESIAVVPGPDGTDDDVYLAVARTVGGATVRWIEWLRPPFRSDRDGAVENAFFVDAGLTYEGTAATTISGADHLDGETVSILADGIAMPEQEVLGGTVTVEGGASVVHVGLPYTSTLTTLPVEAGAAGGTAQGVTKRIARMWLRLHESVGCTLGNGRVSEVIDFRDPDTLMDGAIPLFTGDRLLRFPGGFDMGGQVTIEQSAPLPLTVLAVITEVTAHG